MILFKKTTPFLCAATAAFALSASVAQADELRTDDFVLDLDQFEVTGTNCQEGGELSWDEGRDRMEVEFGEFAAESGGRLARAACNLAVAVKWDVGYRLVISEAGYRGYASVEEGASAVVSAEFFTAGGSGARLRSSVGSGAFDEAIEGVAHRSDCSGEGILRFNMSALARGGDASVEISSARFNLTVESCEQ